MDPYLGEIRCFGFNFAPVNWLLCNGQVLAIQQYTALFSLLGTMYGGNGTTTFAVPDLRGRVPLGWGQGSGLSPNDLGQAAGTETVTLQPAQLPPHNHTVAASSTAASKNPSNAVPGLNPDASAYGTTADLAMSPTMVGGGGSSSPVPTMPPYLVLNWCICWSGIYPPRQ